MNNPVDCSEAYDALESPIVGFDPNTLYSLEYLALKLGVSKETVQRRLNLRVTIAGRVSGRAILRAIERLENEEQPVYKPAETIVPVTPAVRRTNRLELIDINEI